MSDEKFKSVELLCRGFVILVGDKKGVEGLEHMLDIDCGYFNILDLPAKEKLLETIMPILQKRFNFEWRLVETYEFWEALK